MANITSPSQLAGAIIKSINFMEDIEVKCKDCGRPFTITAGEQEFFSSKIGEDGKPFQLPKRCPKCRLKKKQQKQREERY